VCVSVFVCVRERERERGVRCMGVKGCGICSVSQGCQVESCGGKGDGVKFVWCPRVAT